MTASGSASTEPAPAAAASPPAVVVRVVAGNPTESELAALVTTLAGVIGQAGEGGQTTAEEAPAERSISRWADPRRRLVSPHLGAAADGWRSSALPR